MTISIEALRAVQPRQAAVWLRANGWELVDTRPEHTATYRKSAGGEGDYIVDLPLDATFRDYARRMGEVLETLVIASGKKAAWVLDEVRSSTVDIIRLRSSGPSIGNGHVPVDLGTRLFSNARDLLLAASCSAHEPRPAYRSRKPREAKEFMRRVKLAAPESGSFVVTIHAPVPPKLHQLSLLEGTEEEPFERKSTLMLASAIVAARQAAEQAGLGGSSQPFLNGTTRGISANLCDALAAFVDGEEATELDVRFGWAASRLVPDGTPTSARFGADLSPVLREGARLLRETASTPDFELEGAVVRLDSSNPEAGGDAVIAGLVDGKPRKVRVPMDPSDYAMAIRAHEQGQLVRCEGELVQHGPRFRLERVRHVSLVLDED